MKKTPALRIIRPRLFFGEDLLVGPGKIDLLRAVAEHGSISGAARASGMSFKRAWVLLNELEKACERPAIASSTGGRGGGGATLTEFGRALIEHYEAIETACESVSKSHLKSLQRLLDRAA